MKTEYSHTYILKPTWSRVMHRMHTLGNVVQHFQNSIASISTECDYPRLIASALENSSSTLDGSQIWKLETWQKGIVKVNAKLQQAQFSFTSETGETFHTITLTPKSHWECFECIVRLFESSCIKHTFDTQLATTQPAKNYTVNKHIAKVAKSVNREIIQGKKILCTLPLAGGSSSIFNLEAKSLMTQFGRITLKKNNAHLQLDPTKVAGIEITKNVNKFSTIIFNIKSEPMLHLQAV